MCLIKIEDRARVATTPIKVYKILRPFNHSPYQNQEYHVGKNTPDAGRNIFSSRGPTIDGGYLHAYLTESQAVRTLDMMFKNAFSRFKIVEMYIPIGTEYWLGEGQEVAATCLYWPEDKKTEE